MSGIKNAEELLKHLQLETIDEWTFIGQSKSIGSLNIYGGQVLGQSLSAAYNTVGPHLFAHSIHSYFYLPGDFNQPVVYKVEKLREGRSFSTRNVKAIQNDKTIYECIVSFQIEEEAKYEHQFKKPFVFRTPKMLFSWDTSYKLFKNRLPKSFRSFLEIEKPIEVKTINFERFLWKRKWSPTNKVWFRFKEVKQLDISYPKLQQMLLYSSDYNILMTATFPHPGVNIGNTHMATIDHAMWFHRKFSVSDTFLYIMDSPNASNSRAFTRGSIFTKKGKLIASVTQEGLMRARTKKK